MGMEDVCTTSGLLTLEKKHQLTEQAQDPSPELPCDVTCYEIAEDKKKNAITTGFIFIKLFLCSMVVPALVSPLSHLSHIM